MTKRYAWASILALTHVLLSTPLLASEVPVSIIFDTDIGPDCDDVGALVVLHSLADRGEVNLLGVMCCTSSQWGAPCLDALNTYYGRPHIPVGMLKDTGFLDGGGYAEQVARRFPHRLKSGKDAPDATALYRQLLAAQEDQSVVIAAVGPLRNLQKLVESAPDAHSALSGEELISRKVTQLSCMGGRYPAVPTGQDGEWNFAQDGVAAKVVVENWPTPIIFSGGEIGGGIMTGRRVALDCPEYNPTAAAYGLYVGYGRDRESWDLTSALVAGLGVRDVWPVSPLGVNRVGDKGANTFTNDPAGQHRYLMRREPVQFTEDLLEDLLVTAKAGPIVLDHDITLFAKDGFGSVAAHGSEYGPETAQQAFDRSDGTIWYAGSGESWLQFQCADGRAYPVSRYVITAKDDNPRSWNLIASNDGRATWVTLDSHTDESFQEGGEPRVFRFPNTIPFDSYRLCFPGDKKVHVAELSLFEHIENTAGVAVNALRLDHSSLQLPVAGHAVLNVSVLPADAMDKHIHWTSSASAVARVKRIGKNTAMVFGVAPGVCSVTATSRDGRKIADSQVTVAATTLPTSWTYEEVNTPHVPGAALCRDGVFTLTGGGMGIGRWWKRNWDQFALVSQKHDGDCAISARLTSQTTSSPGSLAGLMFRETTDRESRFVALGVHPSGELIFTWRDSSADENPRTKLGKVDLPIHLKLVRRGNTFQAYTSADGIAWGSPLGQHIGKSHEPSQKVGLWVTASLNPTTSTAQFEQVRVETAAKSR